MSASPTPNPPPAPPTAETLLAIADRPESPFASLNDGRALVVGASGGIGLGLVQQLLEGPLAPRFSRVVAASRQPAREGTPPENREASPQKNGAAGLQELAARHPSRLTLLALDGTDEAQVARAAGQLQANLGRLHLAVNCIGLLHDGDALQPEKSLRQIDGDRLLRYFQVNSLPAILLAKHLLPLMRHDEPSVLATVTAKVGSIADNFLGGWYGYRASKAAANMLVRTAAIEYGRKSPRTRVVALHPGTTDTALSKPFQRSVPPEKLFSPERTARQLLGVMAGLGPDDSGQFFSWDGSRLPW